MELVCCSPRLQSSAWADATTSPDCELPQILSSERNPAPAAEQSVTAAQDTHVPDQLSNGKGAHTEVDPQPTLAMAPGSQIGSTMDMPQPYNDGAAAASYPPMIPMPGHMMQQEQQQQQPRRQQQPRSGSQQMPQGIGPVAAAAFSHLPGNSAAPPPRILQRNPQPDPLYGSSSGEAASGQQGRMGRMGDQDGHEQRRKKNQKKKNKRPRSTERGSEHMRTHNHGHHASHGLSS